MNRDGDDDEKNLLTAKMRAALVVPTLPPDFAERVTLAWLTERADTVTKRRGRTVPVVLATLTLAVAAIVLLLVRATPRPFLAQRSAPANGATPRTEPDRHGSALLVGGPPTSTKGADSRSPPSLPAAAPRNNQPYHPVSARNIQKMPDIDADACGQSIEYPSEAMRLGIEGDVILRVELDEAGRVHGIRVLSGLGHGLDEAAVFALTHKCRFTPAIDKSGSPVAYVIPRYVFHFAPPISSTQTRSRTGVAKAPPGQGRACSADNKCSDGLHCIAKSRDKSTCEILCEDNTDCPEDQRCVADSYGDTCRPISDINL
jgi:TonB family protein